MLGLLGTQTVNLHEDRLQNSLQQYTEIEI